MIILIVINITIFVLMYNSLSHSHLTAQILSDVIAQVIANEPSGVLLTDSYLVSNEDDHLIVRYVDTLNEVE